ncbi:MAG TPA: hypothetical protein VGC79_06530 [Polyangiaceae bacterium]
MNFRKATDELLASVTLQDIANELGVSLQAVRQARSNEGSTAFRPPPEGWENAVKKLAETRGAKLRRFAERLKQEPSK